MVRVLSLNVTNGGLVLEAPLLARLDELGPDLVALQEIRSATDASGLAPHGRRWAIDQVPTWCAECVRGSSG